MVESKLLFKKAEDPVQGQAYWFTGKITLLKNPILVNSWMIEWQISQHSFYQFCLLACVFFAVIKNKLFYSDKI